MKNGGRKDRRMARRKEEEWLRCREQKRQFVNVSCLVLSAVLRKSTYAFFNELGLSFRPLIQLRAKKK